MSNILDLSEITDITKLESMAWQEQRGINRCEDEITARKNNIVNIEGRVAQLEAQQPAELPGVIPTTMDSAPADQPKKPETPAA